VQYREMQDSSIKRPCCNTLSRLVVAKGDFTLAATVQSAFTCGLVQGWAVVEIW
jgi:hypothetical protein